MAHWALQEGIAGGEVVALMMDNRPEFLLTWLGLAKIGCTIALINTNLTGGPLLHSLKVCHARRFIIGMDSRTRLSSPISRTVLHCAALCINLSIQRA